MLIRVRHVTRYVYDTPVSYSVQSLRLTPPDFDGQHVIGWRVACPPAGEPLELKDGFGNVVHLVTVDQVLRELAIEAAGTVETEDRNGVVSGLFEPAPPRIYLRETVQTRADGAIRALAQSIGGGDTLDRLHRLSAAVRDKVDYQVGTTHAHTSAAEALADGQGVCQDHAHIFIAAARALGVPARYITGYLVTGGREITDANHAWAEAWVEGLGWVGFDVANRICPTDHYVRLAAGLDAAYAAPIRGSRRGGEAERLLVAVEVQQQSAQQ
jgi:transglutaminase-like putative cysteine protease